MHKKDSLAGDSKSANSPSCVFVHFSLLICKFWIDLLASGKTSKVRIANIFTFHKVLYFSLFLNQLLKNVFFILNAKLCHKPVGFNQKAILQTFGWSSGHPV